MSDDRFEQLQARFGYVFRDPGLLTAALTHKSYLNESKDKALGDNERLEFLGDAVLDLAVSEHLIAVYPSWTEGDLSRMKARLVSEETLAGVARRLGARRRAGPEVDSRLQDRVSGNLPTQLRHTSFVSHSARVRSGSPKDF
jgi:dsRNA-specific ribonuclease